MRDRLSFAAIGLVSGALLAILVWSVYGIRHQADLTTWLKYFGAGGAVAGFVLKERIGDLIGGSVRAVSDAETPSGSDIEVPRWLFVMVIAGVVFVVWRFAS